MKNNDSEFENLTDQQAINKIKEIAESAKNCFFTTNLNIDSTSRPMALQGVDDQGNLWFLSDLRSKKNNHITKNSKVELYFMNNSNYEYLFIKGNASISQNKDLIDKYWTSFANAWFDGKDDPNLSLLKIAPYDGYYYETKDNKLIAFTKMIFSAISGNKNDDGGLEGSIKI